jgi:hypothetical protein
VSAPPKCDAQRQPRDATPHDLGDLGDLGDLERAALNPNLLARPGDVPAQGDDVPGDRLVAAGAKPDSRPLGKVLKASASVDVGEVARASGLGVLLVVDLANELWRLTAARGRKQCTGDKGANRT